MSSRIELKNRGSLIGRAAVTSFVGRQRELAEAKTRMVESRLLTLTGPGGVGKTRMAVELVERSRRAFSDGVYQVGLDSLESGERVASLIADVLQIPDQSNRFALERVIDYLEGKEVLLLLDNCEHVLQATAEVVDVLLAMAPRCRVLATSREPLGISGEYVCVVPPLSTPPLSTQLSSTEQAAVASEVVEVENFESVAMLVDRARQVIPDFAVTPENRADIAQICARLDGIPLAIELAAIRLRVLSPSQLLERLDQRFQLLNKGDRTSLPRQQTLQSLIDWSFELCTPAEQCLWRRLSIFPGSFDLEAAEQVCGFGELSSPEILDLLEQLVLKSIVLTERAGEQVRYRMLMTIREYGGQLFREVSELGELRRRHRDLYLERVLTRSERWCGPGQSVALAATRSERPNLMVAMDWSLHTPGEHDAAARMAATLRYHWVSGSFLSDGRLALERILRSGQLSDLERGTAAWAVSWVCLIQGDHRAAADHLRVAERIAMELDDQVMRAHHDHWKGLHQIFTGELPNAIGLYLQAVAAHERDGRTAEQLLAMFQLVMALTFHGESEEGLVLAGQARILAEAQGERWNLGFIWWISGVCHWHLGDHGAAREAALKALDIQHDFHDVICTAMGIELLSWVAVSTGEYARGWELATAADSVWQGMGTSLRAFGPHIAGTSERSIDFCRQQLGLAETEQPALREILSVAEALAVALGTKPKGRKVTRTEDNPLTAREMEVAELVTQGLTNRQIAEKFTLSRRTVDGHVERILNKLGFSSRTQVAAWVESLRAEA
ncbi:Putative HTH-type transcriptional regulator [Corynebacterium occultum]|uniref:HTH-type transcriptional regulator n=1 Tax=Corynebacterium occultum TaxID=2675219 RepID=A0A6B8VYM6_9CORY|nr:LuxR C-terminal-related transcriptional regulator [Corynebacterium occultum]QGU06434.1 Putative HTH-type transcriptional regulator [Corynebacterium occultum]